MQDSTFVIGLTGLAGVGKDSVGQVLVRNWGFERRALADSLRAIAEAVDPYISVNERLSDVLNAMSWDDAKRIYPEVRRFLQHLGSEGGRNVLGDDIWLRTTMKDIDRPTVITDVRFMNEIDYIKGTGGIIVKIVRPGFDEPLNHSSEKTLFEWNGYDYLLNNDGTLDNLESKVQEMFDTLEVQPLIVPPQAVLEQMSTTSIVSVIDREGEVEVDAPAWMDPNYVMGLLFRGAIATCLEDSFMEIQWQEDGIEWGEE